MSLLRLLAAGGWIFVLSTSPLLAAPPEGERGPAVTYSWVAADTHSTAGGVLASADYELAATTGHMADAQGDSTNYLAKPGFAGQLYDPESLAVTVSPDPANEESTAQGSATLTMDDSTILALANNDPDWSVVNGAADGIDASGLVNTGTVYQTESATIAASYAGVSGTGSFDVQDSAPDNFAEYAGDGITDEWQVDHFGLPPNADAAPGENPDSDSDANYFEWLTGYDPNDASSFFTLRLTSKSGTKAFLELSQVIPGTVYTLERSTTLAPGSWDDLGDTTTATTQTDFFIIDSGAPDPAAFYRILVAPE